MAINIYPEDGDSGTETLAVELYKSLSLDSNYIFSGYELSDGGGLIVDVAIGTGVVSGVYISSDSVQNQTIANNDTSYIFLKSDGTLEDNVSGTPPSDSVLIGKAVTSGGSISSFDYSRDVTNNFNAAIIASADQTINNSSTLTDDDHLIFPFLAGQMWEFKIGILITTPASATPDFKFSTNQTVGIMTYTGVTSDGGGNTVPSSKTISVSASGDILLGTSSDPSVYIHGYFVGEADGNFIFKWAQRVATASDIIRAAGSFLVSRQLF